MANGRDSRKTRTNETTGAIVYFIYLLCLLISFAIIGKIIYLQFFKKEDPEIERIFRPRGIRNTLDPSRGSIISYDGRLLAMSTPMYQIRMDCTVQKEAFARSSDGAEKEREWLSKARDLSRELAATFGDKTADEYYSMIYNGRKNGSKYLRIGPQIDHETLQKVKKFPLFNEGGYSGGMIVVKNDTRQYPYGTLARRTIGYIKVTAGNVTINGTAGSYLTLDHAVANGSTGYEDGFVVMPGCTLTMNVPMVSNRRVDKWRNGTVVFTAPYTNTVNSYSLIMGQGTNIIAAGGSIYLPNDILNIANGDGDANGYTTLLVQDDASIFAKGIAVSIGANSWNAGRVVQDGAASRVEAFAGNLEIGRAQKAGSPAASYTLKDGHLSVKGNIHLGLSGSASLFRQEGGTSRLDNFIFTNSVGRVELAGGQLYADYDGVITRSASSSVFAFSGGTYMTSTNRDAVFGASLLELSGTPTLQAAAGRIFYFPANIAVADDTVFTQSSGSSVIRNDVEVAGNSSSRMARSMSGGDRSSRN